MGYRAYINKIRESGTIDDKLIEYIETSKEHYVFGDGLQAAVCLGIFHDMGIEVRGLILPLGGQAKSLKGYWGRLIKRVEKYQLSELSIEERKNAYVIMGISMEEYKHVEEFLRSNGIDSILGCCWQHNSELNGICYDIWKEKTGRQ